MTQILGPWGLWFWWIIAAALLLAEMMAPGFFMLWLAVAAAVTAVLVHFVTLPWEGEVFAFAVFSAMTIAASWRFVKSQRNVRSDQPHLNQKQNGFVGKTYVLDKPIIHGSGKIKVEDALWDVDGEDAAAGTKIKVIAVEGLRLRVEKA